MNHRLTCIHSESGLCPNCQEQYDEDPISYEEYGDHPDGLARWREMEALMKQEREESLGHGVPCFNDPDPSIPF